MSNQTKHKPVTGRDFIRMMAPMFGLENVPGIREIRIKARFDDVAELEIDGLACPVPDGYRIEDHLEHDKSTRTRRYRIAVTEITDDEAEQ